MRLFSDKRATTEVAATGVLGGDLLALVSASLFAAETFGPLGTPLQALTVTLWAMAFRLIAEAGVRTGVAFRLRRPSLGSFFLPGLLATLIILLELGAVMTLLGAPRTVSLILLVPFHFLSLTGADSTFRKIRDGLLLGILASGLAEGAPLPLVLAPAALFGMLFSNALRRQLAPGSRAGTVPLCNLRNARLIAGAIVLAMVVAGVILNFALSPAISAWSRMHWIPGSESMAGSGVGRPDAPRAGSDVIFNDGFDLKRNPGMGISGGGASREDVLLAVSPLIGNDQDPDATPWQPSPRTLWKARTYLRFSAGTESWAAESRAERSHLTIARNQLFFSVPVRDVPAARVKVTAIAPTVDALVLPYFTQQVDFTPQGTDFLEALSTPDGDILWLDRTFNAGDSYVATVSPIELAEAPIPPDLPISAAPDPAYVDLEGTDHLGFDLRAFAKDWLGAEPGLAGKLDLLKRRLTERFYAVDPSFSQLPRTLKEFAIERPVGSCRHFSTLAALLLRAQGVPTRVIAGFVGGQPNLPTGELFLRRGDAHAWIEVLAGDLGFVPVDVTRWVPVISSRMDADPTMAPIPPEESWTEEPSPDPTGLSWDTRETLVNALWTLLFAGSLYLTLRMLWRAVKRSKHAPQGAAQQPALIPRPPPEPEAGTPVERLLLGYRKLQRHLDDYEAARRIDETPREHARRVTVPPHESSAPGFQVIVPMVYDALYGEAPITDAEADQADHAAATVRKSFR